MVAVTTTWRSTRSAGSTRLEAGGRPSAWAISLDRSIVHLVVHPSSSPSPIDLIPFDLITTPRYLLPTMTLVEGDDMQRLWALVVDLSSQLNMNRQQITSVQTQLQNLKAHSVHTNTGFALRRFNVDVAKETFESELERLNVHLAQENNDLRWENKMNERLIKEYEQCLDLVMKKFRAFSVSASGDGEEGRVSCLRFLRPRYLAACNADSHPQAHPVLRGEIGADATMPSFGP